MNGCITYVSRLPRHLSDFSVPSSILHVLIDIIAPLTLISSRFCSLSFSLTLPLALALAHPLYSSFPRNRTSSQPHGPSPPPTDPTPPDNQQRRLQMRLRHHPTRLRLRPHSPLHLPFPPRNPSLHNPHPLPPRAPHNRSRHPTIPDPRPLRRRLRQHLPVQPQDDPLRLPLFESVAAKVVLGYRA